MSEINGKEILITGCGSLGKELLRYLLVHYKPKGIRIYSRSELNQFRLREQLNNDRLIKYHTPISWLIGDIRDLTRLKLATKGVDVIINTAAMKRIEVCESDPLECIKTNIHGVENIIAAAIENSVEKVLQISTDKAVYPSTLYGSSKKCAEDLIRQANTYSGESGKPIFACVRYGNVFGSNGSVVQIWKDQAKDGIVNVTDPKMTRFWITQHDVVHFMVGMIEDMQAGSIYVPMMSNMPIVDMVQTLHPEAKINYTYELKIGEKIHECLLTDEESRHTIEYEDYFEINYKKDVNNELDWSYTSDSDTALTGDQLKNMIGGV